MELPAEQLDELWRGRLSEGQRAGLIVASDSMAPLIRVGDRIIVERYQAGEAPGLGDIVLFDLGGGWVVHRIIGRESGEKDVMYRQRGDSGHRPSLSAASSIAGRVIRIERRGGAVIDLKARRQVIINGFMGRFFYAVDAMRRFGRKHVSPSGGTPEMRSSARELPGRSLGWVERAAVKAAARLMWGKD